MKGQINIIWDHTQNLKAVSKEKTIATVTAAWKKNAHKATEKLFS